MLTPHRHHSQLHQFCSTLPCAGLVLWLQTTAAATGAISKACKVNKEAM
jgi:hypothetical protein